MRSKLAEISENNKIWLFGLALPILIGSIGKIFFGIKGLIYGFIGTFAVEIVIWAWRKG